MTTKFLKLAALAGIAAFCAATAPAAELESLESSCNSGDVQACNKLLSHYWEQGSFEQVAVYGKKA